MLNAQIENRIPCATDEPRPKCSTKRAIPKVCQKLTHASPSGTDGTVVRTTDEGATWQRCATPPDADKNGNPLSLPFVVGPHGRIGKLNAKVLAP